MNLNPLEGLGFGGAKEAAPAAPPPAPANGDTLHNTRGRKGHKLPRINMAFTPENHKFITFTSRQQGISATEYVNNLIDAARSAKKEDTF
jgi:hypothetical protein